MESVQNSAVPDPVPRKRPGNITIERNQKPKKYNKTIKNSNTIENNINKPREYYEQGFMKYSKEANEKHSRHKRAARRDENKNTCSLYIQTDPLIWRHIRETFPEVKSVFIQDIFNSH